MGKNLCKCELSFYFYLGCQHTAGLQKFVKSIADVFVLLMYCYRDSFFLPCLSKGKTFLYFCLPQSHLLLFGIQFPLLPCDLSSLMGQERNNFVDCLPFLNFRMAAAFSCIFLPLDREQDSSRFWASRCNSRPTKDHKAVRFIHFDFFFLFC